MKTKKIIDFTELIDKSTRGFVGRQWVRDAVDRFLVSDGPRYFLLLGEPGSGKTAFMADFVQQRGYPHHFIGKGSQIDIFSSLDWRDPIRFAESIGYQLVCDYGGWVMSWEDWGISVKQDVQEVEGLLVGAKVREFKAVPRPADRPTLTVEQKAKRFGRVVEVIGVYIEEFKMDVEQVVRQLLMTPLRNIADHLPEHQVVVVVDGLDEAEYYSDPTRSILNMLPDGSLPSQIRFLLSSRPGEHLTPGFLSQTQVFWLSEDDRGQRDPRTTEDAKAFVMNLANDRAVSNMLAQRGILPETLTERVATASQGNFLYLHHYAEGLWNKDETLLNLEALPGGLYGIYEHFLAQIKERRRDVSWDQAYKPVLGVMAVAKEPLTRRQIADFSRVEQGTVGTILIQLREFVDSMGRGADRRYSIYHRSFAEYLVSEENPDYIDGQKAHKQIVECFKAGALSWKEVYPMKYLLSHMIASRSWDEIETLLKNIEYLEKKQSPAEQYRFQNDFTVLLRTQEIPTEKLVDILEGVLKVVCEQLETGKQKADWLDIFAYWINEFGKTADAERTAALKDIANKFDYANGIVSKELALRYQEAGENNWALRFAELHTWVYQRAGCYSKCVEACHLAENICLQEGMEEAYRILARAEFMRMRARALKKLSETAPEKDVKENYESQACSAYRDLNRVLQPNRRRGWQPTEVEWQQLEEDTGELPVPPSADTKSFKVQVVSNAHDCMGAIHVIQFLEKLGAAVKWIHTSKFRPGDMASHDTLLTILIGGPKAPGIADVAHKFYEADKEGFLELYSAKEMVASVLKMKEGDTLCCMVGGPSKVNTLMAAYQITQDKGVIDWIKHP